MKDDRAGAEGGKMNFDSRYQNILSSVKLRQESWLKYPGRCRHEWFKFNDSLITEMNTEVFPVPKELLSRLVQDCFDHEWCFAREYTFSSLIKLMKSSENIDSCRIDWEQLETYKTRELFLICLPYKIIAWKDKLKKFCSEEDICELFNMLGGQKGASGTYSGGTLILLNSDYIASLADCAEILEHELIHMLKNINKEEEHCSEPMRQILGNTQETDTWTANLINALFVLYDHKQALFSDEDDTPAARKQFLDAVFVSAADPDFEEFYGRWKAYENSKLLEENLFFLWGLLRWQPEELPEIKGKIYREFQLVYPE